jgi:1-acyl-sn-glycerol-3-phosphate acyltransferase
MSICIFPEGGVPDESIALDAFKDGAFRMAINHQIPIVPITFGDNKKRFSYTFLSGSPGQMRSKVHHFLPTEGLEVKDTKTINAQTHQLLLNQLNVFNSEAIKHKKATLGTE